MPSIYQVPLLLEQQKLVSLLKSGLRLEDIKIQQSLITQGDSIWEAWKSLTTQDQRFLDPVVIALVGKYTAFHDSYLSVLKSLEHSAMRCKRRLELRWVDSEDLESANRDRNGGKFHKAWQDVCTADGILVPGGFGTRGTEGMIAAANWARENDRPYLGICLGMQVAVIEYARNVCGVKEATSEEFSKDQKSAAQSLKVHDSSLNDKPIVNGDAANADAVGTPQSLEALKNGAKTNNLIVFMPEIDKSTMGGTMRLGRRATHFQAQYEWSKLRKLYGNKAEVHERHRHRYEVNPAWVQPLEEAGLAFVGKDDEGLRMEIVEIKDKKWFVGVQYHPEYLSRVLMPSRPYLGFVAACSGVLEQISKEEAGWEDQHVNGVKTGGQF